MTEERTKFIAAWQMGGWSMSELCRAFGVSRKTGYKWLGRYQERGLEGLRDESRAAHYHPNATAPEMVRELLRLRRKWGWGGRKTVDYLALSRPRAELPAASTVDEIYRRHGLVKPRRKKRKRGEVKTVKQVRRANDRWCADFKGWFRTADGRRCDPLTITDSYSRLLLRCQHVERLSFDCVKPQFERVFREYGLPWSIRTDNGAPFATTGIAGLSQLSAWLMRLGIYPDFIEPGKPQQNARHERMHRTLKAATAAPAKANLRAQQRAFHRFRKHYNEERPHEGIGGKTPQSVYEHSPRQYPNRLPELEYPDGWLVRRVQTNGVIKLDGVCHFLGAALRGHNVALEPISDLHLAVHFGPYQIATLCPRTNEVLPYRKPKLS